MSRKTISRFGYFMIACSAAGYFSSAMSAPGTGDCAPPKDPDRVFSVNTAPDGLFFLDGRTIDKPELQRILARQSNLQVVYVVGETVSVAHILKVHMIGEQQGFNACIKKIEPRAEEANIESET